MAPLPAPLSKRNSYIIGGSVGGAVLVGGLIAIFLLTGKQKVPAAVDTLAQRPPLNATASGAYVKRSVCAPPSPGYAGPVACTKAGTCAGCAEANESNPYSCVAVTGGNNEVLSNGQLAIPMRVNYVVPENGKACRGHGTVNAAGACVCATNFSGKECEVYTASITSPGSYCLPAYASKCLSPTTDSVLMNPDSGKGGQFMCSCKPEYAGLFAQRVGGGVCDMELACGAGSPQMNAAQTEAIKYQVFKNFDATGEPVFELQPVTPNRLTSHNISATETCYAKTVRDAATGVVTVAPDADPTCTPQLQSNKCVAATSNSDYATTVTVRGSTRPGDPLLQRVSPPYYPPVPPALQRCPDGYTGKNTPSSPCMKDGQQLFLQPTRQSRCGDSTYSAYSSTTPFVGTGTWYGSAFDESGEWNGAFACVNDLSSAQLRQGASGTPVLAKDAAWRTVDKNTAVSEVDCRNTYEPWRSRMTPNVFPDACVGKDCGAVRGSRRQAWNGDRDGALMDSNGDPWFTSAANLFVDISGGSANVDPIYATFGGQCACDGIQFRGGSGGGGSGAPVASKLVPAYLNKYAGSKESWWTCAADSCASESNPTAYLDVEAGLTYPRCVCNPSAGAGAGAPAPPYSTHISYAEQNSMPRCIADPCNPLGFKTDAHTECLDDSMCTGVCYGTKCHYPRTYEKCLSDAGCTSLGSAKTKGKCVSLSLIDPTLPIELTADINECIYEDIDRAQAGTACKLNRECSYGKCVGFENTPAGYVGMCSGGCACAGAGVQVASGSSPLGFTCAEKCQVNPCENGGECTIDAVTGEQKCVCSPCFSGDKCEISGNGSRKGEYCDTNAAKNKDGYWVCCEEGSKCENFKCT